ncbi:uncharacterized protein BKA78DRAFT_11315 [Phyllosticta capitalensis]|uniref:uncharacterized protein n=1 Tax=Phyllosticta capitalensis TaxID=121624 RepID=UPI0031314404
MPPRFAPHPQPPAASSPDTCSLDQQKLCMRFVSKSKHACNVLSNKIMERPGRLGQRNGAAAALANVQVCLAGAEDEEHLWDIVRFCDAGGERKTYTVNCYGTEYCGCHGWAVLRVFGRAHHDMVVCLQVPSCQSPPSKYPESCSRSTRCGGGGAVVRETRDGGGGNQSGEE